MMEASSQFHLTGREDGGYFPTAMPEARFSGRLSPRLEAGRDQEARRWQVQVSWAGRVAVGETRVKKLKSWRSFKKMKLAVKDVGIGQASGKKDQIREGEELVDKEKVHELKGVYQKVPIVFQRSDMAV